MSSGQVPRNPLYFPKMKVRGKRNKQHGFLGTYPGRPFVTFLASLESLSMAAVKAATSLQVLEDTWRLPEFTFPSRGES